MPRPPAQRPTAPRRAARRPPRPRSFRLAILSLVVTLLILAMKVLPHAQDW